MSIIYKGKKFENVISIKEIHTLFEIVYEKDFVFSGKSYDYWVAQYVKKGEFLINAGERIYHLSSGDIIFHKPMEFHKLYVEGNESGNILVMAFTPKGRLMDFFINKLFILSDEQKGIIECIYSLLSSELELNDDPYDNITYSRPIVNSSINLQSAITYIIQLLISLYESNNVLSPEKSRETKIFKKAVNYMNDNIYSPLSIKDIAEHCNISQTFLKQLFSKFTGLGVHKYFLKLRLNAATVCLKNGDSITETADKFGFSSQAYFSEVFKRETGINPSKYKKTK